VVKPFPKTYENFKFQISWEDLDLSQVKEVIKLGLYEDAGGKFHSLKKFPDITTKACKINNSGEALIVSREPMVVCGLKLLPLILESAGAKNIDVDYLCNDGDSLQEKINIARLSGSQFEILTIERIILNFLQRLSGIATKTHFFSTQLDSFGVHFLDTRKTTPTMRGLEKYATACGGGFNHRMGLFDRILIKDNHLAATKCQQGLKLENFLSKIVSHYASSYLIEVEIDSLEQLEPALRANVDAVLLDNFSPEEIEEAVSINKQKAVLEASGGINENTLQEYARSKPHFISSGYPIHSGRWMDIGMDWS